jgi:hypothetical protein
MIAEQKINMERNLVKIKLRSELIDLAGQKLSIFNEETDETTFMRNILFKQTINNTKTELILDFFAVLYL